MFTSSVYVYKFNTHTHTHTHTHNKHTHTQVMMMNREEISFMVAQFRYKSPDAFTKFRSRRLNMPAYVRIRQHTINKVVRFPA